MLNSMRKLSGSIVSKLLMLLLVVSFGVWGVGDILRDSGPGYAAKVGGETITTGEFQQQNALVARQLQNIGMQGVEPNKLKSIVLRQLIQQKLTLLAMHDMGLFVNDTLVGSVVADIPEFKDKNGKFSSKLFADTLANQRLSEAAFVGQMKRDIAGKFLVDSLNMSDALPPESVLSLEQTVAGETRDAVLITIPARASDEGVDEAALTDFYEKNKAVSYMNSERRTLEYVVLSEADLDALVDASITDDMLAQAATEKPDLAKPLLRLKLRSEQRDSVLHTLTNRVEDELAAGQSLAEAFHKAGVTASVRTLADATAEQAQTSNDDIVKTVAEQGFGLSQGEVSNLVTSKKGARLMVAVKAITPAAPKPFESVKADVKTRLTKQLARDAAITKARTVKEALGKEPNWQAVTESMHLATRMVSRVARPVEGKASPNAALPPALQQALFEHAVGESAGPLTLENGDQLLAVITESHLPKVTATSGSAKSMGALADKLAGDIQNRAYQSFTAQHPVKVNPALLRATPAEAP